MFSSTGVWTSPYATRIFGITAVLQGVVSLRGIFNREWIGIWPMFVLGANSSFLGLLATMVC
ncbi:MAG: hypothetical protein VXZ09_03435, partial [Pseudomonadota bacterium]|nr:hypothetical protein [Pseudomonadota bacterium]